MPPVLYTVNSTCRIFSDITKKKRYKLYGVIPIPFNCSNKKFPTFFSKDFACPRRFHVCSWVVTLLVMPRPFQRGPWTVLAEGGGFWSRLSPGQDGWNVQLGWSVCQPCMVFCLWRGWSLILSHELGLILLHYNFIADLPFFNVKQIRDLDIHSVHSVHCFLLKNHPGLEWFTFGTIVAGICMRSLYQWPTDALHTQE